MAGVPGPNAGHGARGPGGHGARAAGTSVGSVFGRPSPEAAGLPDEALQSSSPGALPRQRRENGRLSKAELWAPVSGRICGRSSFGPALGGANDRNPTESYSAESSTTCGRNCPNIVELSPVAWPQSAQSWPTPGEMTSIASNNVGQNEPGFGRTLANIGRTLLEIGPHRAQDLAEPAQIPWEVARVIREKPFLVRPSVAEACIDSPRRATSYAYGACAPNKAITHERPTHTRASTRRAKCMYESAQAWAWHNGVRMAALKFPVPDTSGVTTIRQCRDAAMRTSAAQAVYRPQFRSNRGVT